MSYYGAFGCLKMGGSQSKESEKSAETIVVSRQANVNFDHDSAQWWAIGTLLLVLILSFLLFVSRRVYLWGKNLKREQQRLRQALVDLRATSSTV